MKVDNLNKGFASMVSDIDLRMPSDSDIKNLKILLDTRKVIFFEDQNLSKPEMENIGELLKNNSNVNNIYSEINSRDNPDYGISWHSDVTYRKITPTYTAFQLDELELIGQGDTLFCDTVELFKNTFSESFKEFMRNLTVENRYLVKEKITTNQSDNNFINTIEHIAEHPLVLKTTLISGETVESLFFQESFTKRIKELRLYESRALIDFLTLRISSIPEFQYRHRWKPGSLVIWNNFLSSHRLVRDYNPEMNFRAAKRVIIF